MEARQRLSAWERRGIWALALFVLLFGALTTYRAAFLQRKMGDFSMFFRAGWAARTGGSQLYTITGDNALHYHYPPGFACLLMPFADPPPGAAPCLRLPYAGSVVVWYLFNVLCLAAGVHILAAMLESAGGEPPSPGSRRWWALRIGPVLVCMPCICSTLAQGQVTPLLFALIAAGVAAAGRSRRLASGMWLATAAAAKIFPAFLLLLQIWRRDVRGLAGAGLAFLLALVAVPVLAYGPAQTLASYQELEQVLIAPSLGWGKDESRSAELLNLTGPHSQSLVSAISSIIHPDRTTRPPRPTLLARILHWTLGLAMTLATLWAFRRPRQTLDTGVEGQRTALFGGALCLVMLVVCPVSHLHYLMLALPAVMALFAIDRGANVNPGPRLTLVLAIHVAAVVLAQLPALSILKDKCLPMYGIILLWAVACRVGARMAREAKPTPQDVTKDFALPAAA